MVNQKLVIENKVGLHARPASLLVSTANRFRSSISVKKDEIIVNAKSILGILSLGAEHGTEVEIIVDGEDEEDAIQAISNLIQNKFGEDE